MEKRILNIISRKYIAKVNKYIVELGFHDEPKQTLWLTEKQMINLQNCFNKTKRGYSDKNISVIGVWNGNGYFAYAKIKNHPQSHTFKLPYQYDLSDLKEVD